MYWVTYFGLGLLAENDIGELKRLGLPRVESFCDGTLIVAYASSGAIGSEDAMKKENAIRDVLAAARFFDKAKFDTSSLRTSPEPAAQIETVVSAAKKSRSP